MEIIGWIGSICLALCSIPEVIVTLERGYTTLSWGFLLLWTFGEILVFIPIVINPKLRKPWLLFNYGVNILGTLILFGYKCLEGLQWLFV